jgi:hypothetical protein
VAAGEEVVDYDAHVDVVMIDLWVGVVGFFFWSSRGKLEGGFL